MENKFVAVGFLFNPKTKSVLLHHRDAKAPTNPNKWGFFGGAGEGHESPIQAFIREMKEELNIDIKEQEIIPLWSYLDEKTKYMRNVFYIESEMDKSQMTLSEGQGFDWIPFEKAFDYDLHDKARNDLQRFIILQN